MTSWFEELPRKIKKIPFKDTGIAAIPFLCYLIVYSNYSLFRTILGLGKVTKPNHTFLPWMEMLDASKICPSCT